MENDYTREARTRELRDFIDVQITEYSSINLSRSKTASLSPAVLPTH